MSKECITQTIRNNPDLVLMTFQDEVKTVKQASNLAAIPEQNIIKTIVWVTDSFPIVTIVRGDCKVSVEKTKRELGVKEMKIADSKTVRQVTGYDAGGVPPICLPENIKVVLDKKVLEKDKVVGGGGDRYSLLEIPVKKIIKLTNPTITDISLC